MKKKVWNITVKDNPNRVLMGENDEFYTTDTEAYLVFKLDDKDFNPTSAVLTLENRNDGSLKNETIDVVHNMIVWEMPQRYIEHFGNWQGQLVYEDTKDGQPELYTSATFSFVVRAHIGDKKKPSLVEIENWEKFIREGTELIETWEDMEGLRQANELQRQEAELDRQAQEEAREVAEGQRVESESTREANEQTRLNKDRLRDDKIAQMEADKDAVIANATVDSEVILARGGFSVLGDRLDNIDRELSHLPIMGVEWDRTTDPTMTRIGATKGLVANVGIGDETVRNDFDTMPIYREMQRETDKYGNVFVRVPKFYIRKTVTDELYRVEISKEKLKGFYLPACFYDFEKDKELDYFLYGAYIASSADGTKLESKAGVKPLAERNIVQFRDYAMANGEGYQQLDIHAVDVLQTLFRVEFATLNSQSLHPGFTSGNAESAFTGGTDELTATSGAVGTSGSHQFVYRGIEDPWGNVYQFVDGVNINDHQAWVCRDARQYASNVFASPYEKLGYVNATENTWVTKMGYDPILPFSEFPISGGGGTTTYYADHYYQSAGQRIALFGGSWSFWANAGLSLWSLHLSSAYASSGLVGRLMKKTL